MRRKLRTSTCVTAVVLSALAAAGLVASGAPAGAAGAAKTGAPGALVTRTAIAAPAGAHAWRVTYHSRSVDGRDVTVSGVVVAPDGPAPKGGRTVVTWAHGTTGIADQCAPSRQPNVASQLPYVADMLQAGYVVAATDYEGLGTAGVHPYLVGESEGRSVLDAARAATAIPAAHASDRVLVFGHSQGGGAALFAGELAPRYAPELDVRGVVAAAPAADVEHILPLAGQINGSAGYVAMAALGFDAAYPDAHVLDVLTPEAREQAKVALTACSGEVLRSFSGDHAALFASDPLADPKFAAILHENSAGNRRTVAPILVVQGTADGTIPKVLTDAFVAKACGPEGDEVLYRTYDGADHGTVIAAARTDVLAWLAGRARPPAARSTAARWVRSGCPAAARLLCLTASSRSTVDLATLIAVFAIVVLAATVTALTGFGFALVGVPLLAVAVSARDAVVILSILSLPMNVGLAWLHRREVVRPTAKRQIGAAVLGMPIGLVVLLAVSQQVLLAVIAATVLVAVVALARGIELHPHGPGIDYGSGFVSGVLATSVGVNGPPLVAVYQARNFAPGPMRATVSAVFFVTGVVASVMLVAAGAMSADGWLALVPGVLAIPVGWFVGHQLHERIDPERFRVVVLALLVLSALTAAAQAVSG
ncbi:MAG: TSUP family transporter [Acidimicrobiia bacterium]